MTNNETAFQQIIQLINNSHFQEITEDTSHWRYINLRDYHTIQKDISGVYALWNEEYGWLYIGKATSIFNRLKSHHNATGGNEKAACWLQFFNYFKDKPIRAYYYRDPSIDGNIRELMRKVMERLLQIKYHPLFDKVYPIGKRKAVENFEEQLKTYSHALTPGSG